GADLRHRRMAASRRNNCCTRSDCISRYSSSSSCCLATSSTSLDVMSRRSTISVRGNNGWPSRSTTRNVKRSRSWYSRGRPVLEKPTTSFSRSSRMSTSRASASAGSSTSRVSSATRTSLRNSAPTADVGANPVYSVRNGSAAERRSWYPQPVSETTAADAAAAANRRRERSGDRAAPCGPERPKSAAHSIRAAPTLASDDDVDQPTRHHDHLAGGASFGMACERVGGDCGRLDHRAVGAGGHLHGTAHLAVDLQHQLDLVLRERSLVDRRPRRIEQVAVRPG